MSTGGTCPLNLEAPIPTWVYYDLELKFRNSLVEKYFYDKCANLYYCERDAGVFVPGQIEITTLDNLQQLLYKYPDVTEGDVCELGCVSWLARDLRRVVGFATVPTFKVETLWAAMAYGRKGVYFANQLRGNEIAPNGNNSHNKENGRDFLAGHTWGWTPLSSCPQCSAAYHQIVSTLEAAGWTRLNEQSSNWHQTRFVLPRKHLSNTESADLAI